MQNLWQESKSRFYPDPDLIQTFLQEHTGFTGTINSDDRVCNECYKSHLTTIKHLNSTVKSTSSVLATRLEEIQKDLLTLSNIHTLEQALTQSANLTAIHVGTIILKNTAILLSEAYEHFQESLMGITTQCKMNLDSYLNVTIATFGLEVNFHHYWSHIWLITVQYSVMVQSYIGMEGIS